MSACSNMRCSQSWRTSHQHTILRVREGLFHFGPSVDPIEQNSSVDEVHPDDQVDGKLAIDGVNGAHTRAFAYTHLVSFSKFNCALVPPWT